MVRALEDGPEDVRQIEVAVGRGVVKVRRDLQKAVDGGSVLVRRIDLDVVEAEAQLRLEQPVGDVGEEADGAFRVDQRACLEINAGEGYPAKDYPSQAAAKSSRSKPVKSFHGLPLSLYHAPDGSENARCCQQDNWRAIEGAHPGGATTA